MKNRHILPVTFFMLALTGFQVSAWAAEMSSAHAEDKNPMGSPLSKAQLSQLTLAQAVKMAYQRLPQRKVFDSMDVETGALARQSRALFAGNPALSASYQTDRGASDNGLEEWEAGIELPLWRFGQKAARQSYAEASSMMVTTGRKALLHNLAGRVRETIWDVHLAQISLAQAKKEWETTQVLEQDVKRRVQLGESAKTDLMLAKDQTLSKHDIFLIAEAELVHALKRYQSLTGHQTLPANPEEEQSEQTAIANTHPVLAEQLAEVHQSQSNVRVAGRERAGNPQLLIGTRQERDIRGNDPITSFGLSVRIPFGIDSHSSPKTAAAQVTLSKAQSKVDSSRRELQANLHEAEHELETSQKRFVLVTKQTKLADESLRLAKRAFSLGENDLKNLLRIQSLAFNAERNKQQLKVSIKRAIARYNQAIGVLP